MKEFLCPFTNQTIKLIESSLNFSEGTTMYSYPIMISAEKKYIRVCDTLFSLITNSPSFLLEKSKVEFEVIRSIILYKIIQEDFNEIMHWNCDRVKGIKGNTNLLDLYNETRINSQYPINRIQKARRILFYIEKNQKYTGDDIELIDDINIWGQLFMRNYDELVFYIEELEREELLSFNRINNKVRLTFKGLDYLEKSDKISDEKETSRNSERYDIALSFAGEERSFVKEVALELKANGINVFYDEYNQSHLWGKDLYQHLNSIYKDKCEYCIVFISENYKKKLWTKHELKAAQTRAFNENTEYILPVRFDDTELEGLNCTTGYLETKNYTPKQIARMAIEKLKSIK